MNRPHAAIYAIALLFVGCLSSVPANALGAEVSKLPEAAQMRAILQQPESKMDFAKIKLTIDKMVDPTINVDAGLRKIDDIAAQIRAMLGSNQSSHEKMLALKKYLYEKGPWNNFQHYQYDLDDPRGTKINNKLLTNYLATKKGNCVSMPLLFIVLGQRLGIDVTASTAPEHVFVKYTDFDTMVTYNLEATSGANPTRDVWYRQQMPMTDEAIANGIYLQKLTKRETVAVMANVLVESFAEKQYPEKVIAISDAILPSYPKNIALILWNGSAHARLIKKHFVSKYPAPKDIPVAERPYFQYLSEQNAIWFSKAESLGWRQPTQAQESRYLQNVNRAKSTQ